MIMTALLAFAAGFFAGNALPYYVAGSTGDGRNPSPFGDGAAVCVLVGTALFAVAVVAWNLSGAAAHPILGWSAALLGVLTVGLVHTRTWRGRAWGRRQPDGAAEPA